MKLTTYLLIGFASLATVSCDDFLDRAPLTDITDKNFFHNAKDLETYTNGFYSLVGASYDDAGTDNVYYAGSNTTDQVMSGQISSQNIGGWSDWGTLRSINYFLDHSKNVEGASAAEINHYTGIARYFRAQFYMGKVQSYSDVPWYGTAMSVDDSLLYKKADPRAVVMDSVLNDIQFAADHIKEDIGTRTRISRWAALAYMARICLYEGTYRKYHSELNLGNDYTRFLQKAVEACQTIMNSGKFSIYGKSGDDYAALFCSPTLNDNPEIILQIASDKSLGISNNTHVVLGWQWALSRNLMESYLTKEGKPFTSVKDYDKKTFNEVFVDRDPRLKATFAYPGFKENPTDKSGRLPKFTYGGYDQLKFYPLDPDLRQGWALDYTSLPVYRYAEVLLTYAEARAELGQLTQDDLDKTINLLRDRVQMPHLNMAEANANPDPVLVKQYPNVSGPNQGVILEIRRERRVETACEGLRWSDIQRWCVGDLYAESPEGVYIPKLGTYDFNADGKPDIAVLASPKDTTELYKGLTEEQKKDLSPYYLKKADGSDDGFYLTNGTSGHVAFTSYQKVPRSFKAPQYYYRPIPAHQVELNHNLKQPFGWE